MKRLSSRRIASIRGFSLVELSIVMAIVGTVATLGLEGAATFLDRSELQTTEERIQVVDEALLRYRAINGRLPCPGLRDASITDAGPPGYGKEYCNNITKITSSSLMQGMVPVRDLNLPLEYAIDGYGSKFNYVVTSGMTSASTFAATGDGVSIRTGKLNSDCTTNCSTMGTAAYLVMSPGYDRRGGVSDHGATTKPCIATTRDDQKIDAQNCAFAGTNTTTMAVTNITPDVFYDSRINRGFSESNYFDDIVVWHPKSGL